MATRGVKENERVASLGDTARLELISHSGPQLYMSYRLSGGLYFSTTVWYPFQLEELDTKYGAPFMEDIYFHCALFEMNKLCTLVPSLKYIDLGDWSKYFNKKLGELWRVLTIKSFGEWRFLNNLPNWKGPEFFGSDVGCSKNPVISIEGGPVRCLAFNGGGKDSLASMKLLEDIGEPFHSISYAHSMFGQVERQCGLTESLVKYTASKAHHRLTIIDSFLSSPLPGVIPNAEVKSIVAFEIFSAVFETLPLVLMHGYTSICLGNERSANKGNLVWDGEEINHQWIKSYECESLFSSYIKENLISNLSYFSSLMPVHDPLIFSYLTPYAAIIPFTHSCNFGKPWCLRCPKCCYVWLGFSAYFPQDTIRDTFGDENVFDVEENQVFFIQMLGLGTQKPFECIGEVPEVQLAFALCCSKGIKGKAMEIFEEKVAANFDVKKCDIIAEYCKVYTSEIGIPELLAERMLSKLGQVSEKCKEDILKQLKTDC